MVTQIILFFNTIIKILEYEENMMLFLICTSDQNSNKTSTNIKEEKN